MNWKELIKSKHFRRNIVSFVVMFAVFYGMSLISGIEVSFFELLANTLLFWVGVYFIFYKRESLMMQQVGKK